MRARVRALRALGGARGSVLAFMNHSVHVHSVARPDWGCMRVNSVLEMAGVGEALVARASARLMVLQRFFRTCLREAGATPAQAGELAAMLILFDEGIRMSSRRRLPDGQHLRTIDATFQSIRSAIP